MKKILLFACITGASFSSISQVNWQKGGNSAAGGANPSLGTNATWNSPLLFQTFGVTRMHINGETGVTAGFIGIGTTSPLAPLHIVGFQQQNAQGWRRGIILGNASALLWDGGGGQGFFMAHPSSSPTGNWYAGAQAGIGAGAAVDYAMTVYVNTNYGTINPLRSTQIFKNLLVFENEFGRRLGVNTHNPQRASEIYSNTTQMRLSYGTAVSTSGIASVFTDFETNPQGNLQIMPTGQRVGINLFVNPSHNLDVNGNTRIRNIPVATPNCILVGTNQTGAADNQVSRLDFTGNSNQVLLGNGTWGAVPVSNNYTATNGIVLAGTTFQLGARCTNPSQLNASRFVNNRAVYLNGHSFWMYSGVNQIGGVGFGAQPSSTGLCSVGNTVEISANDQGVYGNTDASGLRLTKLTSNSPVIPNGTNGVDNSKVLTVDENGDVVLTNTQSSTGNGFVDCLDNTGAANLLTDSKMNLNNNNLYFENNDLINENHIGVGYDCGVPLPGKVSAVQMHPNAIGVSTTTFSGINSDVTNTAGTNQTAFHGVSNGVQPIGVFSQNIGGNFEATNSENNLAVFGYANGTSVSTSTNIAGAFRTVNGTNGTGVRASSSSSSTVNYGVLSSGYGGIDSYGIHATSGGATGSNTAGYFVGDVFTTTAFLPVSDQQFKTQVQDLESTLKVLTLLRPKSYYLNTVQFPEFNFGSEKQYGFVAQDLELVLPEIVHTKVNPAMYDEFGNEISPRTEFKAVNYTAIIPLNTKAIIELNEKVDRATLSDSSIKTNVIDLDNSLNKVLEMRGISYDWNHSVHPEMGLDSVNHVGFIAQEIAQIDSRLTYLDEDSLLHVEYDKIVPVLAEAIQELNVTIVTQDSIITDLESENAQQQTEINDLNNRLTQLENCLSSILPLLCQLNNSAIAPTQENVQRELAKAIDVQLSDKNNIVLNQNVPNPFAEKTVISYSIPESVGKAQIHFYDGKGTLINTVEIVERGSGEINVYASDLSSGVYTYSLVADGQIVSTKRMMKN